MIRTHAIRVLGRELQLKSSSTPEQVALVEALVNKKLAEAALTVKSGESQVAVILAMMNLAEACLEAQTRFEEECRASQVRLSELIERLSRQAL